MPPDDVQKEIEQLEQRFAENSKGLVFAHLADAYRKAGEYGKAEGLILHGLKNHPNYISAYNVLGRVYLDSERPEEAHEQFSKVLELDPHNLIALRALGDLAVSDGKLSEARGWYERMLQVDPRNEEARDELEKLEGAASGAGASVAATGGDDVEPAAESTTVTGEGAEESSEQDFVRSSAGESVGEPEVEEASEREPWEFQEIGEEAEGEEAELSVQPVEGLMSEIGRSGSSEADTPEAPSWDDQEEIEAADRQSASPSGGTRTQGEDETPEEAGDHPGSGPGSDFQLGDMEAWTPGFITDEELAEADTEVQEVDEDFNFHLLEREDEPGSETEGPVELPEELGDDEGLVTETMAELYAQQGLYGDALNVYEQLIEVRPNDERLRKRAAELRSEIAEDRSALAEEEEGLDALHELTATEGGDSEAESWAEELIETEDRFEVELQPEQPEARAPELDAAAAALDPNAPIEELLSESPGLAMSASPDVSEDVESAGGFEFEDEAPVAGLEHLDPFAASFDVLAKADGQDLAIPSLIPREREVSEAPSPEPEAAPEIEMEPATETVAESELESDAEWEPAPAPEPAGEVAAQSEDVPDFVREPESEARREGDEKAGEPVASEPPTAELEPTLQEPPKPEEPLEPEEAAEPIPVAVDEAAEEETPDYLDRFGDVDELQPGAFEPTTRSETEMAEPEPEGVEVSIEEYLGSLLAYEPAVLGASEGEDVAATMEPEEAAPEPGIAREPGGAIAPAGETGESRRDRPHPQGEDLEEFQEWLRSLKR